MGTKQRRWVWSLLVGVSVIGCGGVPEENPATGAKECVQGLMQLKDRGERL